MDMNLRSIQEFLKIYNSLTESCFTSCVDNFHSSTLDTDEIKCAETCVEKFIKFNNRVMSLYVNQQQVVMSRRAKEAEEEANKQAKEVAVDQYENESSVTPLLS